MPFSLQLLKLLMWCRYSSKHARKAKLHYGNIIAIVMILEEKAFKTRWLRHRLLCHSVSSFNGRNVNICRSYELEIGFYPTFWGHRVPYTIEEFFGGGRWSIVMPAETKLWIPPSSSAINCEMPWRSGGVAIAFNQSSFSVLTHKKICFSLK